MATNLIVPEPIEAILHEFNASNTVFTEDDVSLALVKAQSALENPSDAENLGAWSEVLAFSLERGTNERDGKIFYFPDVTGTLPDTIEHWAARARIFAQPLMKARYADLVWEMAPTIPQKRRDPEMARIAIDAYFAASSIETCFGVRRQAEDALRALNLSVIIRDNERTEAAKRRLIELSRSETPLWDIFDRLIGKKNVSLTDDENRELITSLENLAARFADSSNPDQFNPHDAQDCAKLLVSHYKRANKIDDVRRLHMTVAKAFERFAELGNALLASAVLPDSVNAYRAAGLTDESDRVRRLMEQKIGQSCDQMSNIESKIKIKKEDMESFLSAVVVGDIEQTFVNLTVNFFAKRIELEKQLQELAEKEPLQAHIPISIMADDHVAAIIRSTDEDLLGRVIHQATMDFAFSDLWLTHALNRAQETHNLMPEHFVVWANRSALFDDVSFLLEGVHAWYDGDLIKAIHVLVPQIEKGLRNIVAQIGKPVTKAHQKVCRASVAIGMGEILNSDDISEALGPDLTLYFLAAYVDPRGWNLRNRVAHGLIMPSSINIQFAHRLIHTMLVFGIWRELARARRSESNP